MGKTQEVCWGEESLLRKQSNMLNDFLAIRAEGVG